MLNFLKSFLVFSIGRSSARGTARMVGLGRLATVVGLIGGWRAYKRHRASTYRTSTYRTI